LAPRLAARHATPEELRVLQALIDEDMGRLGDAGALARSNRRFHHQIHLASHNRYLVQQLVIVHRNMALMARSSLAVEGRPRVALAEHQAIVDALKTGDGAAAEAALRAHISKAFETRLREDAGREP
ncbi:MAG: FCD domain-containing protein, partial [Paracoccus sp. (in: a-proteobacteria)]|nr:FCD domain-containing protein [Paracoccus sp. (in: a-proteobacteria)]